MTNPKIRAILVSIMEQDRQDQRDYKITLIKDIIEARKALIGLGITEHADAATRPEVIFDKLYELDINSLEMLDFITSNELRRISKERRKELMP